MKIVEYTKDGARERELSQQEIEAGAAKGYPAYKREIARQLITLLPDSEIKKILELLA
jgi:hypothetical protein